MPRQKRKYQAIGTRNIEPECKKRREERTSLLTRKRKNMVDQDKDTPHKSQKKENDNERIISVSPECQPISTIHVEPECKKMQEERKSSLARKRKKINNEDTDTTHKFQKGENNKEGMVSFSPEYIQHLKESYDDRSYLGEPTYQCKHCNAIFWYNERTQRESKRNKEIIYTNCCKNGKIKIPPYKDPPELLMRLINDKDNPLSNHFLQKIRHYNSLFAFTSMGANIIKDLNKGEGPYIFRINGQIHHRIGSLLPEEGHLPQYAQLYIFDT